MDIVMVLVVIIFILLFLFLIFPYAALFMMAGDIKKIREKLDEIEEYIYEEDT